MPYEVLERRINALPKVYYDELVDFLEFLTQKAEREAEDASMRQLRVAGLQTVWETVKDDTW